MNVELELLINEQIYRKVMQEEIPSTRLSLLIATAYTKQTTIEIIKGESIPFVKLLDDLIRRKVKVFLLFAGKPSKIFIETLRSFPQVVEKMERRLCVRNHNKIVLIDNKRLYLGSANLTGAGLGSKSKNKRNFEFGIFTQNSRIIKTISNELMKIWNYEYCEKCKTKNLCQGEHEKFASALGI